MFFGEGFAGASGEGPMLSVDVPQPMNDLIRPAKLRWRTQLNEKRKKRFAPQRRNSFLLHPGPFADILRMLAFLLFSTAAALDDGLVRVPYMGYNTWYSVFMNPTEGLMAAPIRASTLPSELHGTAGPAQIQRLLRCRL